MYNVGQTAVQNALRRTSYVRGWAIVPEISRRWWWTPKLFGAAGLDSVKTKGSGLLNVVQPALYLSHGRDFFRTALKNHSEPAMLLWHPRYWVNSGRIYHLIAKIPADWESLYAWACADFVAAGSSGTLLK